MKECFENSKTVYIIDGKEYVPDMPKHWFCVNLIGSTGMGPDIAYNPITKKKESCNVFETLNTRSIYFDRHLICYVPIIFFMNKKKQIILKNGQTVNWSNILAIRNWQIHNLCFDYTECPFL